MMDAVMHHVIGQVAHCKTGGIGPDPVPKKRFRQQKKQGADRQAQGDGHHQALLVIRVLMVDAVKKKTYPRLEVSAWREVKYIAVKAVFEERPDRETRKDQREERAKRDTNAETLPYGEKNHRRVNRKDRHGRDFAQALENRVIE